MANMEEYSSIFRTVIDSSDCEASMGRPSLVQDIFNGGSPSLQTHCNLALTPSLIRSSWNQNGVILGGTEIQLYLL